MKVVLQACNDQDVDVVMHALEVLNKVVER